MHYTIRNGTQKDLSGALFLVKELAEFEKEPDAVTADLKTYEKLYSEGLFNFAVAFVNTEIVGVAIYYDSFSTWKGKMYYLEDLIVTAKFRNQGIGQHLFDHFILDAKKRGAKLVKWQVLQWNSNAIRFYLRNKAKIQKGWHNGLLYFN